MDVLKDLNDKIDEVLSLTTLHKTISNRDRRVSEIYSVCKDTKTLLEFASAAGFVNDPMVNACLTLVQCINRIKFYKEYGKDEYLKSVLAGKI